MPGRWLLNHELFTLIWLSASARRWGHGCPWWRVAPRNHPGMWADRRFIPAWAGVPQAHRRFIHRIGFNLEGGNGSSVRGAPISRTILPPPWRGTRAGHNSALHRGSFSLGWVGNPSSRFRAFDCVCGSFGCCIRILFLGVAFRRLGLLQAVSALLRGQYHGLGCIA